MGALEECSLCLDACLSQISSPYVERLYRSDPPRKLKRLKYECKIHMQVCALLSQLNRHQEALCHAKRSVQISQYMINDLMELCETVNQRISQAKKREQIAQDILQKGEMNPQLSQFLNGFEGDNYLKEYTENKLNKSDLIYFDEQVSMLERTALKFYPIIQEVAKRMTKHKENIPPQQLSLTKSNSQRNKPFDGDLKSFREKREQQKKEEEERQANPYQSDWVIQKQKELRAKPLDKQLANSINMRVLLGYLNQSEWMYLLNIGNIMQITPLTIHDLHSCPSIEVELARDSIIEKISFLAVSYFCVSTELRFLVNMRDNPNVDPVQVKAESEYWHGKALEISCSFLPSESPLVSHIHQSYKKHHAPVGQVITEEDEAGEFGKKKGSKRNDNLDLKIIRPLQGIDQCKYQPMVRANHNMNIALSPLNMSPNNYIKKQFEKFANPVNGPVHNDSTFSRDRNTSSINEIQIPHNQLIQKKQSNDKPQPQPRQQTQTSAQVSSSPIPKVGPQPRNNAMNAPVSKPSSEARNDMQSSQKTQMEMAKASGVATEIDKASSKGNGLADEVRNKRKAVDPLNTVTTLNFREIRSEVDGMSPRAEGVKALEQPAKNKQIKAIVQSHDEQLKNSRNEQQQNQKLQPSSGDVDDAQKFQKETIVKKDFEINDNKQQQIGTRFKNDNEAMSLEQIGDLSEIVKDERTIHETIDERRAMHESIDNINNTTDMIIELAERNFGSLVSHESIKNNRNPPPSAQQNNQGITIPNNEQQDPKYIEKQANNYEKQLHGTLEINSGVGLSKQGNIDCQFIRDEPQQSQNRGSKQRPDRLDDKRQYTKPETQSDRNGRSQQSKYLKDTKIDNELLAKENDGKGQQFRRALQNTQINTIEQAQNNQLIISNAQKKSRPKTSENQRQHLGQSKETRKGQISGTNSGRNHIANLNGQNQSHLSDGKVFQNKSYQTLNAMQSTNSNMETNTDKVGKSTAKTTIGGIAVTAATLSTSVHMPSHQSNETGTVQQRANTQQHYYKSGQPSPSVQNERLLLERHDQQVNIEANIISKKKNSQMHDLISPPSEIESNYQRQLDPSYELKAKRHDLSVNLGHKDTSITSAFSNIVSAKNQGSLQKKLQGQLLDQNSKVKTSHGQGKPVSGTRLSKSGKKQKYNHRGAAPTDFVKGRDLVLLHQSQQTHSSSAKQLNVQHPNAQNKLFASQGNHNQQSAEQLHSSRINAQLTNESSSRGENSSRYKQSHNQISNQKGQHNTQGSSKASGLFIQTDQSHNKQDLIAGLEGFVAYRQVQTAIGSTRNAKTPHDNGIGSSNFQTTPVSSQNLGAMDSKLKVHQTIDNIVNQSATNNHQSNQNQQKQSRNVLNNNQLISKSQGQTARQSSTKRYKIQTSRDQAPATLQQQDVQSFDGVSSNLNQDQFMASQAKNNNLTEVSSEHNHQISSNQQNKHQNINEQMQKSVMSINSANRINISQEQLHGQNNNTSYLTSQVSGSGHRSNLEIIQSKHHQLYNRSSNSREKDKKQVQKTSSNVNTTVASGQSNQQQLKIFKSQQQHQQVFSNVKGQAQLVNKILQQQQPAGNQIMIPGSLIKNSNLVIAMGQNSHRTMTTNGQDSNQLIGSSHAANGTSSAIQQNRNFEIQTQIQGQQVKLKASRTSVQTPTGAMAAMPLSNQAGGTKHQKIQQLQAQTANRSASGGSSGARSGIAISSGSRTRPSGLTGQSMGANSGQQQQFSQMTLHAAQAQQIRVSLQKSQKSSGKKFQADPASSKVKIHSSRNDSAGGHGLVAAKNQFQAQQFQTDGAIGRDGQPCHFDPQKPNQLMIQVQQRPGSAVNRDQNQSQRGNQQESFSMENKILKQKRQKVNPGSRKNIEMIDSPNNQCRSSRVNQTLPTEQQHKLEMQSYSKQSNPQEQQTNHISKIDPAQWSSLNVKNVLANGMNQSSQNDLQRHQIDRLVSDMNNRGMQPGQQAVYQTQQSRGPVNQSKFVTQGFEGSSKVTAMSQPTSNIGSELQSPSYQQFHQHLIRGNKSNQQQPQMMSNSSQNSKSAGKLITQQQLEMQMTLQYQQRERLKAVNSQEQLQIQGQETQQPLVQTTRQHTSRPQSSNRNKLQLGMKMQQRPTAGATERTSTSGNERVATENDRINHGNLMILHGGGGGMMSAHHLKQAGIGGTVTTNSGLNTAKNNDHKLKFSGASMATSNGAGQHLDSHRSSKQFIQPTIKYDMKNSSQNLNSLNNLQNIQGPSLEGSMNMRLPGSAVNSLAFPSTPNLQSARGSLQNHPQVQGAASTQKQQTQYQPQIGGNRNQRVGVNIKGGIE